MAPDRILAAAEEVRAEAHQLRADVERFEASQRRKNRWLAMAIAGVFVLTIGFAGVLTFSVRSRHQENERRCVSTNESRIALRDGFAADHRALDGFLATVATSPDGMRFVARLKATHAASEADLAKHLPVADCS